MLVEKTGPESVCATAEHTSGTGRPARAARTRAALVATAREMFVAKPYHDTSLRKIAAAAGYSTGSIYNAFDSKGDLWREAMGCEPPDDTALTRRASDLERSLRDLLNLRLNPAATPLEWEAAWATAEGTLELPSAEHPHSNGHL